MTIEQERNMTGIAACLFVLSMFVAMVAAMIRDYLAN